MSLLTEATERLVAEAFERGRRAAFIEAVEVCEAYAKGLAMDGFTPEEIDRDLAKEDAATQIAVRLAQRATKGK